MNFENLNLSESYLNEIKDIKNKYYGVEDDYIKYYNTDEIHHSDAKFFNTDDVKFIEKRQLTSIENLKVIDFKIKLNEYEFFKNVQINTNNIISIDLKVGGQLLDRIYPEIFNALRKIYNMDDNILPFYILKNGIFYLEYHSINISIKYNTFNNEKLILTYDVYQNNNIVKLHLYENIIFNSAQMNLVNLSNQQCYFNHIIYYFLSNNDIEKINFNYNSKIITLLLKKVDIIDNIRIYSLTNSNLITNIKESGINFARIEHNSCKFIFNNINKQPCKIYAIAAQCYHRNSGMMGFMYTK
jgi:hypothetical protein